MMQKPSLIISLVVIKMIRLSVNVLTSAMSLLERLETYRFSSLSELTYSKIISISAEDIFDFSRHCGWVSMDEDAPVLTKRGVGLLRLQKRGYLLDLRRQMLMDYVMKAAPIWANLIPYGRREAAIFMSKDERACFFEAKLLSPQLDSEIVVWWDTIANQIRAQAQQAKSDIGRIGESNTVKYERLRTDSEPTWMSIDSNLAGYDVRSRINRDDPNALLIEVKASTDALDQAVFHVTSHEWSVALISAAYVFHVWCLYGNKKLLAIISPRDVQPYIPTNHLEGEWESTKIPFSCFKDKFIEIA